MLNVKLVVQHVTSMLEKFNGLILVSSTCFEQPSVHRQEDLYLQVYSLFLMHLCKQFGRRQDVGDTEV